MLRNSIQLLKWQMWAAVCPCDSNTIFSCHPWCMYPHDSTPHDSTCIIRMYYVHQSTSSQVSYGQRLWPVPPRNQLSQALSSKDAPLLDSKPLRICQGSRKHVDFFCAIKTAWTILKCCNKKCSYLVSFHGQKTWWYLMNLDTHHKTKSLCLQLSQFSRFMSWRLAHFIMSKAVNP